MPLVADTVLGTLGSSASESSYITVFLHLDNTVALIMMRVNHVCYCKDEQIPTLIKSEVGGVGKSSLNAMKRIQPPLPECRILEKGHCGVM